MSIQGEVAEQIAQECVRRGAGDVVIVVFARNYYELGATHIAVGVASLGPDPCTPEEAAEILRTAARDASQRRRG